MTAPLAIVILAVTDVRRSADFYRTAFAAMEAVTAPSYVELDLGHTTRLGLYDRAGFGRNIDAVPMPVPRGAVTGTELYLRFASLDAVCAALTAAGARLLSAAQPRPWGETVAYFADPDGNVVAVAQGSTGATSRADP